MKTKKYKTICDGKSCSPHFCKYTKKCVPKKKYTLDTIPLRPSRSRASLPPVVQSTCPYVDDCLTLGTNLEDVHSFFNGLTTFHDVHGTARRIKTRSGSGFIYEVPYLKNKKTTYAILKSSKKSTSDNLLYEFLIGYTYINTLVDKFPCFIYTYGLYYYKHKKDWAHMIAADEVSSSELQRMLVPQTSIHYENACTQSKYLSILIQGLHYSEQISDKLTSQRFLNENLAHVLFILYHTLSTLSKSFTHYDLHVENVLLVRLPSNKCIRYVYHVHGSTVTFICPYIPKIIDYGRCFFDNGTIHSKMIYDKLCDLPKCESCGKYAGFGLLNPKEFYTISSQKKNESHDLRLLQSIHTEMEYSPRKSSQTLLKMSKLLKKVIYGKGIKGSYKSYGTLEQSKINPDGSSIGNVHDAYYQLLYLISSPEVMEENRMYSNDVEGTLHVYDDRPMYYDKK